MPRLWIGVLGFLLVLAVELRAQGEIVLSVGKESVDRREWLYALQHSPLVNSPKESRALLERLVDHKLQVCAAKALGVDTLLAFRMSWQRTRARLLSHYEVDEEREEAALRQLYLRGEQRLKNSRWVRIAHISRYLPQQGDGKAEQEARRLMDSLYTALQHGADFAELARRFSDDRTTAEQGGVLPWMPVNKQVQEWMIQIDDLPCNQVSRPFFSPLGIHLVKWIDRKEALSFEACVAQLKDFRERKGRVVLRSRMPDEPLEWAQAERRAYEGLLVAYSKHLLGLPKDAEPASDKSLQRYFEQHRDRYAWPLPHYRGAVIAGVDKKQVKQLRKYLKQCPWGQWEEEARSWIAAHSSDSCLQVKVGLFQIGKEPAVDKLVYRCGTFVPGPHFPVVQVVGKNLKKGPELWEEVREAVLQDYRAEQKTAQIKALRQKYRVEINEEVLKSVNIGGNR